MIGWHWGTGAVVADLQAEIERLREALRKIATFDTHVGCCEIARAALKGVEPNATDDHGKT